MATKTYAIKEMFLTLQGEGLRSGHKSVFVRFAGCNLWNGNPAHRDKGKGACAKWCDTDFGVTTGRKVERYTANDLERAMSRLWPMKRHKLRWVVITGGEPMLQFDQALALRLRNKGWAIAMETNGTHLIPEGTVDHITLSPKLYGDLTQLVCHELKVVLPGHVDPEKGWQPKDLLALARKVTIACSSTPTDPKLYVQPQDPLLTDSVGDTALIQLNGPGARALKPLREYTNNLGVCINFVKAHPTWALSTQNHKTWNLP